MFFFFFKVLKKLGKSCPKYLCNFRKYIGLKFSRLRPLYIIWKEVFSVVLTNLDDTLNANKAYDRALQLDKNNSAQIRLNYAIFKAKQKELKESAELLQAFYTAITNKQKLSQVIR